MSENNTMMKEISDDRNDVLMANKKLIEDYIMTMSPIGYINFMKFVISDESPTVQVLHNHTKVNALCQMGKNQSGAVNIAGVFYRIRKSTHRYCDFTLRSSTMKGNESELQKLQRAVKAGNLYPKFMLTVYADEHTKEITDFGFAITEAVLSTMDHYPKQTKISDNPFIPISFDRVREHYPDKIVIYNKE